MKPSDSELVRVHPSLLLAHRARLADTSDVQRAYLRFSWGRRRPPRALPVLRWLFAGVAIGLGVASAATLLPMPGVRSGGNGESGRSGTEKSPGRASRHAAHGPALEAPPSATASAIASPPASAERSSAPSSSRTAGSAAVATPAPPLPTAPSAATRSDWQRAAEALRNGELAEAEAALARLEKSSYSSDRQAAELARAQLLVRRGQAADATPTLQRLAREGTSAVVRGQATNLLQALKQR